MRKMKLRNRRKLSLPDYFKSSSSLRPTPKRKTVSESILRRSTRSVKKPVGRPMGRPAVRRSGRLVGQSPISTSKVQKRSRSVALARPNRKKQVESDSDKSEDKSEDEEKDTEDGEEDSDEEEIHSEEFDEENPESENQMRSTRYKHESQEPTTAEISKEEEQVQILLRRKMELGIKNPSGQFIKAAVINRPNTSMAVASQWNSDQNGSPASVIQRPIPPRPHVIKPSITLPSPIKNPTIPVSCPLCYELFTMPDNAVHFEDHARIYHHRFWLDQTRRGRPLTPPKPMLKELKEVVKKMKMKEEEDSDRFVPNCDLGRCTSCTCRGISCGGDSQSENYGV